MNKRLEQMLKGIREEATLAASDYSIEEQDAFFAELAEWATTQREMLSTQPMTCTAPSARNRARLR